MMTGEIAPLNLEDIIDRLLDLRAYSPELARRFDHEDELPEDAVPFLVQKIEESFDAAKDAKVCDKEKAYQELALWLTLSFRYYVCRLAMVSGRPWMFNFPERKQEEALH